MTEHKGRRGKHDGKKRQAGVDQNSRLKSREELKTAKDNDTVAAEEMVSGEERAV